MTKQVQTHVKSVFTGDHKTAAAEAERKKPENFQEIIAKNTRQTTVIEPDKDRQDKESR